MSLGTWCVLIKALAQLGRVSPQLCEAAAGQCTGLLQGLLVRMGQADSLARIMGLEPVEAKMLLLRLREQQAPVEHAHANARQRQLRRWQLHRQHQHQMQLQLHRQRREQQHEEQPGALPPPAPIEPWSLQPFKGHFVWTHKEQQQRPARVQEAGARDDVRSVHSAHALHPWSTLDLSCLQQRLQVLRGVSGLLLGLGSAGFYDRWVASTCE